MNEFMRLQHLSQVEKHVLQGKQRIARQFRIIEDLRQGGRDPAMALRLLSLFERCQSLHVDHRHRLVAKLSKNLTT